MEPPCHLTSPPPHPFARDLQALTCTEDMMSSRVDFLLQQGLSQEEVGRAVLAHPQVLHYKIDSMRERVDYLHNVGLTQVGCKRSCMAWCVQVWALMHRSVQFALKGHLRLWRRCGGSPRSTPSCLTAAPLSLSCLQTQVAACAHRFPQLFSLDIAGNLDPKWRYLTDYICASGADCVDTLCSYPGYFSLSLTNRCVLHCKTDATAALAVTALAHMPALLFALQNRATQCPCTLQSGQFSPVRAALA